ncbi:MAG: chain length determinant family protein [Deltaproteobacteria bacterium]|nr:chain length determinant family protein [Deltaproteobacteria bacterium]
MEGNKTRQNDGFNLLGALLVFLKHKRLIASIVCGILFITVIISLVISPTYRAESQILPPQQSGGSMANRIFSQLGAASLLVGPTLGIKNTNDLYDALLKTRTILDHAVTKFNLTELYATKTREDARDILKRRITVYNDKKSGIMTVGFEDKDPARAAEMVNFLVEELKRLNNDLAVDEASQRRLFFENQLKDVKESLIKSEENLKGFQEKTGVFKIDDQTKVIVEGIAKLRAQVAAKEVQLKVVRSYQMENNPELQILTAEISGLQEQVRKLESKGNPNNNDFSMSTRKMPAVGLEYIRKMREFKYNEALYEILLKEFESAKLDESKSASLIQVIEKAVPPERRIRPQRTKMVLIAGVMGFFLAVFAAFFAERVRNLSEDAETGGQLNAIKRHLLFWRR